MVDALSLVLGRRRDMRVEHPQYSWRRARGRVRQRAHAHSIAFDSHPLDCTGRGSVGDAVGHDESDLPAGRRGSIPLGIAAVDLPAFIHHLFRQSRMVPARFLSSDVGRRSLRGIGSSMQSEREHRNSKSLTRSCYSRFVWFVTAN
jgi:hypothetical protein